MKAALAAVLAKKREPLVVTAVNEGFLPMCRNWLESLKRVGVSEDHVLIFALDAESKQTLAAHDIDTVLVEGSQYGETPTHVVEYRENEDWNKIINKRLEIQVMLLEMGCTFIFSDTDIVFLRDPLAPIRTIVADTSCDLLMQCDYGEEGRPYEKNLYRLCCGFFWVRPTDKTIELFTFSKEDYEKTGWDDQKLLNTRLGTWLEADAERDRLRAEFNVAMLPMDHFANGSHWRLHADAIRDECVMAHYNFMLYRDKIPSMKASGHWYI